jgi:hypothetical protein
MDGFTGPNCDMIIERTCANQVPLSQQPTVSNVFIWHRDLQQQTLHLVVSSSCRSSTILLCSARRVGSACQGSASATPAGMATTVGSGARTNPSRLVIPAHPTFSAL